MIAWKWALALLLTLTMLVPSGFVCLAEEPQAESVLAAAEALEWTDGSLDYPYLLTDAKAPSQQRFGS